VTDKPAARKDKHSARPIRTKRDREGAAEAAKRLADQAASDAAAEARLQALLHELDKSEGVEDDEEGGSDDYASAGPARRWSDDRPDDD
jgi:hypothetical protein